MMNRLTIGFLIAGALLFPGRARAYSWVYCDNVGTMYKCAAILARPLHDAGVPHAAAIKSIIRRVSEATQLDADQKRMVEFVTKTVVDHMYEDEMEDQWSPSEWYAQAISNCLTK